VSAAAERSKKGRQDMNYNIISNISSLDNCSLRWNGKWSVRSGADGGRKRAERDRERAVAEFSTNGWQDVDYNTICNISNIANSSLGWTRRMGVNSGTDGGRERGERDRVSAEADSRTNGLEDMHHGTICDTSSLDNSSLRQRRTLRVAHSRDATLEYTTLQLTTLTILHYTTIHKSTLHCTTQHHTTQHHTTLQYTTPHHTTLRHYTLRYTTIHYTTLTRVHHTTPHHNRVHTTLSSYPAISRHISPC